MQLELLLSNEQRVLPTVRAFTQETLRQLPLPTTDADELEKLVHGAVANAVDHAYPEGEDGSIKLTIREKHGKLEILIRDFGLPQDVALLERQLHQPARSPQNLFGSHAATLVDEMHWLAFGREGKALQLIKWLSTTNIADRGSPGELEPFHEDAPLAPPQQYAVRRLRAEEAVQVSQLMYRAYGPTYFNADVYYPERVAAQNAHGTLVSFVAVGEDGRVAGHYALELDSSGPVAEGGQAVVDPAHRGRGLLDRLKDASLDAARRLNLIGWYGDAVTVHTLTQKSDVTHGGHLSCVELGVSPKTERFRNLAEQLPQRVTCLMYFHWLKEPAVRTVYVPDRHRAMTAAIYENLHCPVRFGERGMPAGHGTLRVEFNADAGRAVVQAEQLGTDSVASIRHAKRELVERSRAEVVFVKLPAEDPATPALVEELEKDGFAFTGVAPHFSTRGDMLQLVYAVEPLARAPIKTYEAFAARLVDYVLAEQNRVQAAL